MTKLLNLISSGLEKMADETLSKRSSFAMFGEIELPDVLRSMAEEKSNSKKVTYKLVANQYNKN